MNSILSPQTLRYSKVTCIHMQAVFGGLSFFISKFTGLASNLSNQEKNKNYFHYFDSFLLTGMKIYKCVLKSRFPVLLE